MSIDESRVESPRIVGNGGQSAALRGRNSAVPPVEPPPPARQATGEWLYADKPLSRHDAGALDTLGLGAYADALALLMDRRATDTPLTIAISGAWGSGKTSLAEMAAARLPFGSDWGAHHVVCRFDAWANDDAPYLGAAFAAAVARTVNVERHWWVRLISPLPSVMLTSEQRWRRRLLLGGFTVLLATAAIFWPTGGLTVTSLLSPGTKISTLTHGKAALRLAWPLLAVAVILLTQKLGPGIQAVARWIDSPGSEAASGSMEEASGQLGRLMKQALRGRRRLIIFVDNLERCRPPRAVEVCEVVSQLIGHKDVITVLIGDMETIALSAEIKYAALESLPSVIQGKSDTSGDAPGSYGRAYMEKLIQIQISLPRPQRGNLQEMLVPADGEPHAFPREIHGPGFVRRVLRTLTSRNVPKEWAAAAGLSGVIATIATLGADALVTAIGLIGVAAVAVGQVAVESRQERQEERRRDTIDTVVGDKVDKAETTLRQETAVTEALEKRIGAVDAREVRRRMRQRIISQNDLRAELDHDLLEVLPLSPRGAKRMFNHAHLLLDIGVERGIFAGRPRLRAAQLAAWVGLTERWPTVATAITDDPVTMERLEQAARVGLIGKSNDIEEVRAEIGIAGVDQSLLDYLRRTEQLAPVARLLAHFSPLRPLRGSMSDHSESGAAPGNARTARYGQTRAMDLTTMNVERTAPPRADVLSLGGDDEVHRSDPTAAVRNATASANGNGTVTSTEILYIDALAAQHAERWDEAIRILLELQARIPGYKDTDSRLDRALRGKRAAALYDDARAHADAERWAAAVERFKAVLAEDPDYRDSRHQLEIAELWSQVVAATASEEWHPAVSAAKKLQNIFPDETDIGELVESLREKLQVAEQYGRAVLAVDAARWRDALVDLSDVRNLAGDYKKADHLIDLVHHRLTSAVLEFQDPTDSESIKMPLTGKRSRHRTVDRVVFGPDSAKLVIGSGHEVAVVAKDGTAQSLINLGRLLPSTAVDIAFDPSGRLLATANTTRAQMWDAVTGRRLWETKKSLETPDDVFDRLFGSGVPAGIAFRPDGNAVAITLHERVAVVLDSTTGNELFAVSHSNAITSVDFSSDGRLLLTGGRDKKTRIWHADTGRFIGEVAHERRVVRAVFEPSGRTFATAVQRGIVSVRTSGTGAKLVTIECGKEVRDIAFSPDGRMLAITMAHYPGAVQIRDSTTGAELIEIEKALSVSFSPDGNFLAVAGLGKDVRLLPIAQSAPRRRPKPSQGHRRRPSKSGPLSDGRMTQQ